MKSEFEQFIDNQYLVEEYLPLYSVAAKGLQPVLESGIPFKSKGKDFNIRFLKEDDLSIIGQLVTSAGRVPQLCTLEFASVQALARQRLALIAEAFEPTGTQLAAYIATENLTDQEISQRLSKKDQGFAMREVRTSLTITSALTDGIYHYGRYGLNSLLKVPHITNLMGRSNGLAVVTFTDDIPEFQGQVRIASQSQAINKRFGMKSIQLSQLGSELRDYMVRDCPPVRCVPRGDALEGQPCCDCKIWYFDPKVGLPETGIEVIDDIIRVTRF